MKITENKKEKSALFLLTGFLGSGKTTLLNRLLELTSGSTAGVIVNDFGSIGVDAQLVTHSGDVEIRELNGGQIFCSCLSGSFIETIAAYRDLNPDYLFVECSGLAMPSALSTIIGQAQKQGGGFFEYRGTLCVIDGNRFSVLADAVLAVTEQIRFADAFILNKADLTGREELEEIEERLSVLKPGTPVWKTVKCSVPREILDIETAPGSDHPGKTIPGESFENPKSYTLYLEHEISRESLDRMLRNISGMTDRIKGFVTIGNQPFVVNCVGDSIEITPQKNPQQKNGLMFYYHGSNTVGDLIKDGVKNLSPALPPS